MGIGVSVFLIAIGAILAFAVHVTTNGLDLSTVGVILMIVGAIGLLTAMVVGGFGSWGGVHRSTTYVDGGVVEPASRRRVVRDEYVN